VNNEIDDGNLSPALIIRVLVSTVRYRTPQCYIAV